MTTTDKAKIYSRACKILEIAQRMAESRTISYSDHVQYIRLYSNGYAEPGYSDPECGIVAAGNWNNTTKWMNNQVTTISDLPSRVGNLFEKMGIECVWEDVWCSCNACGKLVRTSPDSYGWKASYVIGNAELLCHECVMGSEDSIIDYLESLEGKTSTALTLDIDPADYGYEKYNQDEYESGHYGTVDHPENVAKELKVKGIERFLFQISDSEQFCIHWNVWIKKETDESAVDDS